MYVSNVAGIIVNVYAPADFTCGDTISGDNGAMDVDVVGPFPIKLMVPQESISSFSERELELCWKHGIFMANPIIINF
jgi:hypothetical protein